MTGSSIGEQLKRFRFEKRKTQREVADELKVHYQSVINWEKGITPTESNEYQIKKMFKAHGFAPERVVEA